MNQERRSKAEDIAKRLDAIAVEIEVLKDAEIEANDNKPEATQDSTAGDALDNAKNSVSEAVQYLEEASNV